MEPLKTPESLLVAAVDTTIAAQNMAIAAESMDLGICYIGGIRNDLNTVAKRLSLPELTVPLFGLTIGVPETLNGVKPRMPFENILSENHYQSDKLTDMHTYDELLKIIMPAAQVTPKQRIGHRNLCPIFLIIVAQK